MSRQDDDLQRDRRIYGMVIAVSTFLAIVFVAHHPVPAVSAGSGVLAGIDHIRSMDHVVHGGLIVLLLALMTGFAGFVDQAARARPAMRAGLIMYVTGCIGAIGAAVLDGFVIPDIARHFAAAPADEQRIAYDLIVLAGLSIQNLSKMAFILMSGGILAWAVVLLVNRSPMWIAGVVGLFAGGAPILLLVATGLLLRPANLVAILCAQSAWNACIAWGLVMRRGRPADEASLGIFPAVTCEPGKARGFAP